MKLSFATAALASLAVVSAAPVVEQRDLTLGAPRITFVDQVASLVPGTTNTWHVNFQGYLTTPVKDTAVSAVFSVLKFLTGGKKSQIAILEERMQWFAMAGIPLSKVTVTLPASAGGNKVTLPGTTDQTGKFETSIDVPVDLAQEPDVTLDYKNVPILPITEQVGGKAYFVQQDGVSVISDVDDTIKISEVNSRTALLRHTFLLPFEPVAGMSAAYNNIKKELTAKNLAPSFHYLSRSPWNLFQGLEKFSRDFAFPAGQWLLRDLSLLDLSALEFLVGGKDYKVERIREHVALFPKRRLIMIGDSTEMDAESYGEIARSNPNNILCIAIRLVTGVDAEEEKGEIAPARFAAAFKGVPTTKWFTFTDAKQLNAADLAAGNCRRG
ncbi:hypothetical protein DFJ77DRAFT_68741 [Powellomyces hirtus]|nr:hypothetical protein DFJ77DRAFT_68741 [Powellomyces hirtus]